MRIDLHCHTTISDGELTPEELVVRAENHQLDYLAITDHDSTDALAVAKAMAKRLLIINGVEISTDWEGFEIHVVGLNFMISNQQLQQSLVVQRQKRNDRAYEISCRLSKIGIEPVYERVLEMAKGGCITRAHIAKVIVERGIVGSFDKVFQKFMSRGKPGYVPNRWMSTEQAIQLIHQAGGVAVLAHPLQYQLSNKWLRRLIGEFAEAGGDALEIGVSQIKPDHQRWLSELAIGHYLAGSVGSDFHRPTRWRELGRYLPLPENIIPIWEKFSLETGCLID
ncbi:MAG: 5'-3' exoribonuclease [Candidatus Celerinatantimonas neptuna]|nr:MAG: 5'-3' exoribonuclease [Candidatus Celerinatantimonas neptuna]